MCKSLKSDKVSRRLVERNVKKSETPYLLGFALRLYGCFQMSLFCFVGKPGHVATTKTTQNGSEWHTIIYFAVVF